LFVSQQRNFWMRWRVRVGYPLAIIYWVLAAPTSRSVLLGGIIAVFGLIIRGAASGHLRKYEQLVTEGPYAHTRNPLYFGSAFLAVGFIVAGHSWWAGGIVGAYFAIFYYAVMRNEENDLRVRYGKTFEEYARRVPLFFPRMTAAAADDFSTSATPEAKFSWAQYRRNREYQALIGTLAGLGIVWLRMWIRMRFGR
jgi:protein-S-isoprenylcysteine O-methyltransferase Ste14